MFELRPSPLQPPRPPIIPPAPERETPADRAQPKAKRKRKTVSFQREKEIERLFSVIDLVRDRAIFRLAYHAGLRASEIGLLQMRDYDAKADRIFIHRLKGYSHHRHDL